MIYIICWIESFQNVEAVFQQASLIEQLDLGFIRLGPGSGIAITPSPMRFPNCKTTAPLIRSLEDGSAPPDTALQAIAAGPDCSGPGS